MIMIDCSNQYIDQWNKGKRGTKVSHDEVIHIAKARLAVNPPAHKHNFL